MVRTRAAAASMSWTWRPRLAVLVSVGPTPTGGPTLGTCAGPVTAVGPGGTAGTPSLAPALPWDGAPRLAVPTVLVLDEPPLPQPASNTADRAPRMIRLLSRRVRRRDSGSVNARCMTTSGEKRLTSGTPLGVVHPRVRSRLEVSVWSRDTQARHPTARRSHDQTG